MMADPILRTDPRKYCSKPLVIRLLHAAIILLFVISIFSGYRAFAIDWSGVGIVNRSTYYAAHQTSGLILLMLLPLILIVRLNLYVSGKVEKQRVRPLWFRVVIFTGHIALALLGLAIAFSGWDGAMRGGIEVSLFGLLEWPAPFSATGPEDSIRIYKFHKLLLIPFFGLLSLHIIASLFHSLILQDGLLASIFTRPKNNLDTKESREEKPWGK